MIGGLEHFGEFISCQQDNGSERMTGFRKLPNLVTPAGIWFDLSMSPGNPVPQYYAATPLQSTTLTQSADKGIFHGSAVSPKKKYLDTLQVMCAAATALPMPLLMCDYLLYYPFVDEGTIDEQLLTNSVSLPRWTDGVGVKIMAVSLGARTGGQSFFVNYTNSDGVTGRISPTVRQNAVSVNGNIVSTDRAGIDSSGPFLPLQDGDIGVRSIESVTMLGEDVGLFALVLVKPLFQTQVFELNCPVENQTILHRMTLPEIKDNAYLNFLCLPNNTLSAQAIFGGAKFIFN